MTLLSAHALGKHFGERRLFEGDIEVPNLPVAVDAWGRSACYPQGSFYPLSDGISTHIPPDH